ncbi:hypothetical protein BVIET440_120140 [Burkholderia vietnamiensis]
MRAASRPHRAPRVITYIVLVVYTTISADQCRRPSFERRTEAEEAEALLEIETGRPDPVIVSATPSVILSILEISRVDEFQ